MAGGGWREVGGGRREVGGWRRAEGGKARTGLVRRWRGWWLLTELFVDYLEADHQAILNSLFDELLNSSTINLGYLSLALVPPPLDLR